MNDYVTPLQAYLEQNAQNQRATMGNLQQAGALQTMLATAEKAKRDAAMRQSLAESGGDVEKALEIALKSGDIAAAHQLAPLAKQVQENRVMQGGDMNDPAFLRRAGMALKKPEFITHAERIETQRAQDATLTTMRGTPEKTIQPDPQEVAQSADQGTPAVQPAVVPAQGGLFATLAASENPQIAQAAKNYQAQMNQSSAKSITPAYWQTLAKNLQDRETALLNRPQEPLVPVIKDGKPVMLPRSQAIGLPPANVGAPPVTGNFGKTGDDFLASLPEADRALVKKIANYDIDPKALSTRGGQREKMLSLVTQYDPTYDDTQYANKRRAIMQFGSGPQGNTVRSLNVAIEHIDTLKRAADAMQNGNFTPGNKAYNEIAKVFGVTPPNTFEGIRDMVANEVVKGTIGNSGALQDRAEAAAKVRAQSSPKQLNDLMNGWTELMGGQVKGLERQYEASTKNKDFRERYLTQRTRDAIALSESKIRTPTSPAATAGPTVDSLLEKYK